MPGIIDAHSHTAIEGGVNEGTESVTAEVRVARRHRPPRRQHLPPARRRRHRPSTCSTARQRDRRPERGHQAALGQGARGADLQGGAARHQVRARRERRSARTSASPASSRATRRRAWASRTCSARRSTRRRPTRRSGTTTSASSKAARAEGREPLGAAAQDLRLETLEDVLEGKIYVHAHCYRADEILMLIRVADEFGFKIRTFQHVLEGYKVATRSRSHGAGGSTFTDWWAYKIEAYDAIPYNAAIMASHGVGVGQLRLRRAGAPALREAAKAVKYGGVQRGRGAQDGHAQPGLAARRSTSASARSRSARTPTSRSSAPTRFAPDARVEMTLVDGRLLRPRQGPGGAGGREGLAPRREVPSEGARRSSCCALLAAAAAGARPRRATRLIQDARIVTVSGPVIEKGTVVIRGGKIAAVGADVAGPRRRDGHRRHRQDRLPRPDRRPDHARPGRDRQSVAGTVDTTEAGDVNPHAKAWVAVQAAQRADPGGARQRLDRRARRAAGGLDLGPERADPPRGSTPDALTVKTPVAMHVVYPTGRPGLRPGPPCRGAGAEDASRSGMKDRKKNQEQGARAAEEPARGGARPTGPRSTPANGPTEPPRARPAHGSAGAGRPRRAAGGHARRRRGRHPRRRCGSPSERGLKLDRSPAASKPGAAPTC